jgi:hypothetical protein
MAWTSRSRELENQQVVDQYLHKVLDLLSARPALFAEQGTVHSSWRQSAGKRSGPYYRLSYRDGGKQRCVYLGCSASVVTQVQLALAQLQAPWRERRRGERLLAAAKTSYRHTKKLLAAELAKHELHLQGNEIRGWRGLRRGDDRSTIQ